jgi:DNA polymerase (family X)
MVKQCAVCGNDYDKLIEKVDLRVVPDVSYGAALLYLAGSKAHNIALRSMALKCGLKINKYGIFNGTERIASKSEEEMYQALKLPYIEPELRENRGEIAAAAKKTLPKPVRLEDTSGDLHLHTKESDGADTIEDLAVVAKDRGYSYIAITDHSKRVTVAVCTVHSHFHLSKEKQTERILRAMENPNFTILAHPTGRMIGTRDPIDIDLEHIILAAKKLNKALEINAQPERMDLSDICCRMAKDAGVKMVISTDAHSNSQLRYIKYGVGQARRGWLEKDDVINTLSLAEIKNLFIRKSTIHNQKLKERPLCLS